MKPNRPPKQHSSPLGTPPARDKWAKPIQPAAEDEVTGIKVPVTSPAAIVPPADDGTLIGRLDTLVERINPHVALLLALPLICFLVNPNWLFQGFRHMDPWYYFGLSIDFPRYSHVAMPLIRELYPAERLTWVLPSRLFVALLSPVYGWMAFHLAVYWTSVFCLYSVVRRLAGDQAALVAGAMMACHPMFLGSNGWTYPDSGSILYLLLAFTALVLSARAERPWPYLILSGAMWAAVVFNYPRWAALTPCCAIFYWAVTRHDLRSRPGLRCYVSGGWYFVLGLALTTALLRTCNYVVFGLTSRPFFAFLNVGPTGVSSDSQSYSWTTAAGWIVFPSLAFLTGLAAMARHFVSADRAGGALAPTYRTSLIPGNNDEGSRESGERFSRTALGVILTYDYAFAVLAGLILRDHRMPPFDYMSILIPLEFLLFGVLLFPAPSQISPAIWRTVLVASLAVSIVPLWPAVRPAFLLNSYLPLHYIVGAVAVCAVLFRRNLVTWVGCVAGLAVAGLGLIPAFPSTAWNGAENGLAATQRVAEAIQAVDAWMPRGSRPILWLESYSSPDSEEYRAILAGLRVQALSMWRFPAVDPSRKYAPGTQLVLVTPARNVFEAANASMTKAGMPLRLRGQRLISGEGTRPWERISYWLTFTEVLGQPSPGSETPAN